jgi:hypothetical protein
MIKNRKSITFDDIILLVIDDEINRRGRRTSYSALVNELFAERFAKEIKAKELELKYNPAKFQSNR